MTLHDDALRVLCSWPAPDDDQERLRLLYVEHLREHPRAMQRSCHPDHLTGSAIIVSADHTRVILTKHLKAGLWLQTGGHCEPDDTTVAAVALREAREESGIDDLVIDPIPLRLSRHVVPFCGPVQPAHHLDVQFVAVAAGGAEPTISDESDDVAWFAAAALPEPTDADVRALTAAAMTRLRGTP